MDYRAEGSPQAQRSLHLSPHSHQYTQQGSGASVYPQYSHSPVPAVDPNLGSTQNNPQHLHPSSSPHRPHQDSGTMNPQHISPGYYGEAAHNTMTPSTPSQNASPHFNGTISGQAQQPSFMPTDRSLPSRDVNEENIDEAYVAFILYCNPSFSLSMDTTELKRTFRKPPMSDNREFDIWKLFELIAKLDKGEIKTWSQLVLDLGVEAPDLTKGQSSQKLQQYAVRLKRWMRAMHIDAFFEYLMGKTPKYCTQIPPPHAPYPKHGRDGVPIEEDYAIRALDPSSRPKRGRKKAEELIGDEDDETPPPKRPQLDTSFTFSTSGHHQSAYPNSVIPMSAHPDDFVHNDPWTAATMPTPSNLQRSLTPHSAMTAPGGSQIRWRLNTQDNPGTPHPMSAVSPLTGRPPDSAFDEPMSAVTPSSSRSRSRRRHGPAVSSAWSSNNGGSSGKLRGRPPANRSVRDGPYVTFPANPNAKEGPTIDLSRNTPGPTPQTESGTSEGQQQVFRFPPTPASAISASSAQGAMPAPSGAGRGQRLSLQVPRRESGPVRLVTPTVLVNGESDNATPQSAGDSDEPAASASASAAAAVAAAAGEGAGIATRHAPPRITREDLRRAIAADLIRADMTNRKRLRGAEAKALADALLDRLRSPNQGSSSSSSSSSSSARAAAVGAASHSHSHSSRGRDEKNDDEEELFSIACASWLGLSAYAGLVGGAAVGPVGGVKKVSVQRFRVGEDGYESPVDDDEGDGATDGTASASASAPAGEQGKRVREVFDVTWSLLFGGCCGEFAVKGLSLGAVGEERGEGRTREGGVDGGAAMSLEERVRVLEEEVRGKEREVQRLREKVLEAVF